MARLARISLGFALVVAGVFMLVLPGPGIITIVGGLALLARDIAWAGRLAEWVKRKFGRFAGEDPELLSRARETDPV